MSVEPGRVRRAFRERFGREPDGVWAAPGRVNLIGEHTDYNDGFVLPLALDRQVVVAAAAHGEPVLRVVSSEQGEYEARLADVGPGAVTGWPAYVAGSVWSLVEAGVPVGGLDLVLSSDVPVGAGLSSSAAVECATTLAAAELYGGPADRAELARVAQRAENEVVGVPCGIMDQMAAMTCTAGHALLLDTRSLAGEQIPFDLAASGLTLLVIDTRVSHSLSDGAYEERRRSCEEAAAMLGVPALRDATGALVDAARDRLGPVRYRRARHVVGENARVLVAAGLLRRHRVADIGPLLTASHVSLRDDHEVSCPELDAAVDAALSAGALGARMTGGGFGGSAIALVSSPTAGDVTAEIRKVFAANGFTAPVILTARPSDGARRLA